MSKVELTDGSPVPADRSHTEIRPDGQQKGYVVLSEEERAKGFVKPVRCSYVHQKCHTLTTMGRSLAETYARDPNFYSGTFCCGCRAHFPLSEFDWDDGEPMDTSLQAEWQAKKAAEKEERRQKRIAELRRELAELEATC
jgi:hypothetical protein